MHGNKKKGEYCQRSRGRERVVYKALCMGTGEAQGRTTNDINKRQATLGALSATGVDKRSTNEQAPAHVSWCTPPGRLTKSKGCHS